MMATALGAASGSFQEWRGNRGLWMLAVLFLLMFAPIYITFFILEIFGSRSELTVLNVLDFSLATVLLGKICRLLVSVLVRNWQISRAAMQ